MKNVTLILACIFFNCQLQAQKISIIPSITTRDGIYELENGSSVSSLRSNNNYPENLSMQIVNDYAIDIKYFAFKGKRKTYLQLNNYFRKTPTFSYRVVTTTSSYFLYKSTIKTDHILNLMHEFGLKKKENTKFLIGGGLGIMNTGSGFAYKYNSDERDASGNIIEKDGFTRNCFGTVDFLLGLRHKNFLFNVSCFATPDEHFGPLASLLVEYKFGYCINIKNKKAK